ncbi:MAG: beta-ketoacyl-[acyl-carrier-protein] synthase family protein [Candidatus Omnitrophica bacterium]|nr:beta-ketoacyl-[acyl-carrier-protein] synthase family protein [Candidatus Omnitrophota bacterium]
MNNSNPVITGIGVIAPNAIGKDDFWQALKKASSGIKPISLFDTTYFKAKTAGECKDFKPEDYLGSKGLRNLDRSTMLVCSAAKLALEDAKLEITDDSAYDVGVVTATTLSISADLAKFSKEEAQVGARFVNPALFPPTTMNFPSSQLSIRYKIKGFNTTISTGYTAGLDALKYAVEFIRAGRAKRVVIAGVESLSFSNFVGFYKVGFLAGIKGEEISCPFDKRHNGIVLGEGAGVVILEDEQEALKRKANIYAKVLSVANSFDAYRAVKYTPQAIGLQRSMGVSLSHAGLGEEDIDYISASANSVAQHDELETEAIKKVFNIYAKNIPVSSIKSMLGESVSASGLLQLAASIGAIKEGFIPPTINYQQKYDICDLNYVPNKAKSQAVNNVLINNFGPGGSNTTAVIAKY